MQLKVSALEKSMLNDLKPLITNYMFKPYREYDIPEYRLVNCIIDDIKQDQSSKNGIVLVCEEKGKPVGFVSANKLDWDSKHFGLEMARIKYLITDGKYSEALRIKKALLSGTLEESMQKGIQHITVSVHTEDVPSLHALESMGFNVMDTTIFLGIDLRKDNLVEFENTYYIRKFQEDDLDSLVKISREAFGIGRIATDRFHADPSFPKDKSDELYVEWIVNSCRGFADIVLVAELNGEPVGYLTCKVFESITEKLGRKIGSIVITAVSPWARQRGIYTNLTNSGLRWLADRVEIIENGTQIGNYVSQKVWYKFGLAPKRSQYYLVYSAKLSGTVNKEEE